MSYLCPHFLFPKPGVLSGVKILACRTPGVVKEEPISIRFILCPHFGVQKWGTGRGGIREAPLGGKPPLAAR
jgi:hypothetical protein